MNDVHSSTTLKFIFNALLFLCFAFLISQSFADPMIKLPKKSYCLKFNNPYQTIKINSSTYALFQSPKFTDQAPIVYLLFGNAKALLIDTGDKLKGKNSAYISKVVHSLIAEYQQQHGIKKMQLIVMHTHCHYDHVGGDAEFKGKPGVTFIPADLNSIKHFFTFKNKQAHFNLGGRALTIILTPGHTAGSVSVYDSLTHYIFIGDLLYQGVLYVGDYAAFKSSIDRLLKFSQTHTVKALMGTHNTPPGGTTCAAGTYYLPGQDSLLFSVNSLKSLYDKLPAKLVKSTVITPRVVLMPLAFPCKITDAEYANSMSDSKKKQYWKDLQEANILFEKVSKP